MNKENIISRFSKVLTSGQLSEVILYFEASEAYYGKDIEKEVFMSDSEFDELAEKLLKYNIPEVTRIIKKTIYRGDSGLTEVTEYTQEMISLEKLKYKDRSSISEIKKYFPIDKILSRAPKFDGAALKIIWNFSDESNPVIQQILSRGGLDVTDLFKNHSDILRTKKYRKKIIAGELVIAKKTFLNKYSTDAGGDYENPRNFVGALIKQKEIKKEILNDLNFIECTDGINQLPNNIWEKITNQDFYNLEKLIAFYKSEDFPYLCDGIVLAYIEEGERKVKNNYPLNMLAIKFPATRAKTIVTGFEWTQKKSGNLTPKVMVKHVKLDGSTITCANGYNYQNLIDKHLGIGSEIEIEKSGDIIPVVVKVLTRSNNISLPDCEYRKEGKHLKAMDMEESRKYRFILGLKILQLDGIGETLAEKIGAEVDYEILDLFNKSNKPKICDILGGGVNWQKFSRIYEINTLHLDTLISILQFNRVGIVIAKKIAMIITKKSQDTSNISIEILNNVCRGEGFKRITDAIYFLKTHNVKVLAPVEINEESVTFEMTQDPVGMTKAVFEKKFKELFPNSIHTTLTKDTKYLFCSDISINTGKLNKARKYNIKIVTYLDALEGKL